MKAYITCPVSHSQNRLSLLPEMESIAKAKGLDTFVFVIGGTPEEIFKRDVEQLKSCNLLIAEASERSHGVGMEMALSYCFGLERIFMHEKGTFVTKLAHGMPNTAIIEYTDLADFRTKLGASLDAYVARTMKSPQA